MGVIKTKKLILSLFLCLLFFSSSASGWEVSLEGHWDELSNSIDEGASSSDLGFLALKNIPNGGAGFKSVEPFNGYVRFNARVGGSNHIVVAMYDANNNNVYFADFTSTKTPYDVWRQIEAVENGDHSSLTIYYDGDAIGTTQRVSQSPVTTMYLHISSTIPSYIDDASDYPYMIGVKGYLAANSGTIYNTVSVPLVDTYHMTLTKQDTGEVIHTWNITSKCQTISYAVSDYFKNDGFYFLDLYDNDGKLYYSKLVYYNSLGVSPSQYYTITTDTAADIRDYENNGGVVTGGGTVYLTPSDTENYYQNFTLEFQEPAYNREFTINKIFNTSRLDGSYISLSGLNPNVYNVSIDSVYVDSTTGLNNWGYTVNWIGDNSYIFKLSPDFSSPGAWGYVKDSTTGEKIPYAQIYLSNDSFSTTIYSDENGMYYLGGLESGKAYSIKAYKKDYSTSDIQPFTTKTGETTRLDLYLVSSPMVSGEGLYYAPHSVTFTVIEYWYNSLGLPGVAYSVYNNSLEEEIKTGFTDSKGQFTVKEMDRGTNYTITLTHNGQNYTEYIEPGLSEYTLILIKEGVIHNYVNNWLSLSYSQNSTNATVGYDSNKTLSGASLIATASNGSIVYNQVLATQNGSFYFPFSPGDYSLQFHVLASDGSEASQVWTISSPVNVDLFPDSYPAWLKNTLFTAIIIIFLLAFGKSKNDIACGSVAVLTSFAYFFEWLTCSFNFVVLVWIIAAGAIYLHYKRTGAVG